MKIAGQIDGDLQLPSGHITHVYERGSRVTFPDPMAPSESREMLLSLLFTVHPQQLERIFAGVRARLKVRVETPSPTERVVCFYVNAQTLDHLKDKGKADFPHPDFDCE